MTTFTTKANIDNTNDIIDVRDIIARIEDLESEQPLQADDYLAELDLLKALMDDLKGNGGDEQWDGDWYPVTLVNVSHFTEYAQQLAEDIGAIPSDAKWPNNHIDWDAAADALKEDYSEVEYDGVTYLYR